MASADPPVLEARAVSFRYGARQVLSGVDLEVGAGEIVGLLGPNGSGKTTLLRIVAGVLEGASGTVRVRGDDVTALPRREIARRIAVVPQESTFGFPFTALEVVLMGRHPHLEGTAFESPRDVDLARRALARCGIEALAGRPIHELSSGERQRVVFARALAQATPVLLLDEPSSFLDVRHQVELFDLVLALAREEQVAVLCVQHDLTLVGQYCDRVYLLGDGLVAASGATTDVLTESVLSRVYGAALHVAPHPVTGRPLVLPIPSRGRDRPRS
jgi:iron complex transport system ATP-binding protein